MSRGWKIAGAAWGVFWAFVLVAATVPAGQAGSNLASWADLFGGSYLSKIHGAQGIDHLAQWSSIIILVVTGIALGLLGYGFEKYRQIRNALRVGVAEVQAAQAKVEAAQAKIAAQAEAHAFQQKAPREISIEQIAPLSTFEKFIYVAMRIWRFIVGRAKS